MFFLQRFFMKNWILKPKSSHISVVPPSGKTPHLPACPSTPEKRRQYLHLTLTVGKGFAYTLDRSFKRWFWVPKVPVITFLQKTTSYCRQRKTSSLRHSTWNLNTVLWKSWNYFPWLFYDLKITTEIFHISQDWKM